MKNVYIPLLTVASLFLLSNGLQAQNTSTSSTNVKIVLSDFITAAAGNQTETGATPSANASVTFNYPTATSYTQLQESELTDHLKVTASKEFKVTVKAAGANFVNGTDVIPVDVVDVKVTKVTNVVGSTLTPTTPTTGTVTLSTTDQDLITGVPSGIKTMDVKYGIPAERAQASILGKPSGTYSQVVVYTFSQP